MAQRNSGKGKVVRYDKSVKRMMSWLERIGQHKLDQTPSLDVREEIMSAVARMD